MTAVQVLRRREAIAASINRDCQPVAVAAKALGTHRLATAFRTVRQPLDDLQLIVWDVTADGQVVRQGNGTVA
jgi:hypothetical protein